MVIVLAGEMVVVVGKEKDNKKLVAAMMSVVAGQLTIDLLGIFLELVELLVPVELQ